MGRAVNTPDDNKDLFSDIPRRQNVICINPLIKQANLTSFVTKKLLEADQLFSAGRRLLDLGCGDGKDAISFAEAGYIVDGVEIDPTKIKSLTARRKRYSIRIFQERLELFAIKPKRYAIAIANNSLPFLGRKDAVFKVLRSMVNGLKPGGKLFFSLFGPRDEWALSDNMVFLNYGDVVRFLSHMPIVPYFRSTEEGYSPTLKGTMKYWHIHRFLYLRKPLPRTLSRRLQRAVRRLDCVK